MRPGAVGARVTKSNSGARVSVLISTRSYPATPSQIRKTLNIVMNLTIDIFQNHFKAVFPELSFVTAITIILVYGVMYNPSAVHRFPILTKVIG